MRDKSKLLRTNISKCPSKVPGKLKEEEELLKIRTSKSAKMPPKEKTLIERFVHTVEKTLNRSLKSMGSA